MADSTGIDGMNPEAALGIERAWRMLGGVWLLSIGLSLLLGLMLSGALALLLVFAASVAALVNAVLLLSAKGRVLREKDVAVFAGLARLVSWDPGEGVLFLKNKRVEYVKGNVDKTGGIRLICSLMGEELALRVPLQIQTLSIEDSGSSTKDGIPIESRLTLSWKITNLEQMYLTVGKELRLSSDVHAASTRIGGGQAREGTIEYWLASIAKEKSRSVFSKVNAGRLIFDNIIGDAAPEALDAPQAAGLANSDALQSGVEDLSGAILGALSSQLAGHGITIKGVTIEQAKLPPEIYRAAAEAAASRYSEVSAASAANSRRKMLQAEVDVLGVESVAFKEIAANISGPAVQDILLEIIGNFHRGKLTNGQAGQGDIPSLTSEPRE